MVSTNIRDFGKQLLAQHRISMARLNDAVRRILRVKFRAGLFDHPYVDQAKATDPAQLPDGPRPRGGAHRRREVDGAAQERRRDAPARPDKKSVAVIGPLGNDQHDMLGPWWGQGRDADAVSAVHRHQGPGPEHDVHPGLHDDRQRAAGLRRRRTSAAPTTASPRRSRPRRVADQVVLALGETRGQSGEAAARSDIDLPGKQQELIDAIKATGKPFTVVLFNGRPLTLTTSAASRPRSSRPGSRASRPATRSPTCCSGKVNPGGKLPVSFPRGLGQVPIYYNHEPTGRPCDVTSEVQLALPRPPKLRPAVPVRLRAELHDVLGHQASASARSTSPRTGRSRALVDVTNTGDRTGDDVVQLYIHDPVASISQPVRRLRGFQRVTLKPGEKQTVSFTLDKSDFGFYDNQRPVRGRARRASTCTPVTARPPT